MPDDLLDRARMLPSDLVIDELIAEVERLREQIKEEHGVQNSLAKMATYRKAEVERLRPLAELGELWERLEARGNWWHYDGLCHVQMYDDQDQVHHGAGATLREAVRALLEEVERGE